jgi:alpha-L-fucosidase
MYDSKISDFNILKATPYGKDPMKPLSQECRKAGIQYGFYYSQYQDWHEPKGGGSRWEFKNKGPLEEYYKEKAIPQIKELMSNYGQLGMIWFDTPGGQSPEQIKAMVDELHKLQTNCLFSSRVGNAMGDYRDFGDAEIPETIIEGKWESIFTHNDSWGYTPTDQNYKTSKELIHILAEVASKGGNLMVNIGPDVRGVIPYYSMKYFTEVGDWLKKYGPAIYGTTYGEIPAQIWGVTTAKPQKLFLHILEPPVNGRLLVPGFNAKVKSVRCLNGGKLAKYSQKGSNLYVLLPEKLADNKNTVYVVEYEGKLQNGYKKENPVIISSQYKNCKISPMKAICLGQTKAANQTNSNYFGDWRHIACLSNMQRRDDKAVFNLRFLEPGDYRIELEYSCIQDNAGQHGKIIFNNNSYLFQTLEAQSTYNIWKPMLFVKHAIAIMHIESAGEYPLVIEPLDNGKELFKLRSINFEFID